MHPVRTKEQRNAPRRMAFPACSPLQRFAWFLRSFDGLPPAPRTAGTGRILPGAPVIPFGEPVIGFLRAALHCVLTTGYHHTDLVHHTLLCSGMRTNEERSCDRLLDKLSEKERRFLELLCDERELT